MSELQQFGGDWTIEKLDILTGYLDAYLTALKNFHFKKIYIDAFAGTGSITTRDGQREIAGSARLALLADNHFDQYYFIEKDKKKAAQLQQMVNVEFPKLSKCVHIKQGDANTELTSICSAIDWRFNRALLFLDPYATEVSWTTLETIAKTESFDVWYLFPFSALNRMLRRDGHMEQSWIDCINRLLGDSNWMDEFYKEDPQIDLFSDNKIIKDTLHLRLVCQRARSKTEIRSNRSQSRSARRFTTKCGNSGSESISVICCFTMLIWIQIWQKSHFLCLKSQVSSRML